MATLKSAGAEEDENYPPKIPVKIFLNNKF